MAQSCALILILATSISVASTQADGLDKRNQAPVELTSTTLAPPADGKTLSESDLESFLDGLIPYALEQGDIAGGEIAVVEGGQIIFARGYGYADVKKHSLVSPQDSLFRAASISKLFTGTAVMQLVERGKLDLDRDINDYLDFKIPDAFGKPITLRNLLTQTSGFEVVIKNLIFYGPQRPPPLGIALRKNIPSRIFPPGEVAAYSNYGFALAGYIVEQVSGVPFADYVAQNIFAPLGMNHSTFVQPLPREFAEHMVSGYFNGSGEAQPYELVGLPPVGALSTTANDMARFMIAHLQDGALDGARILKPETAQLMHSHQRSEAPEINGYALAFYEESRNGHRIIGHSGDTQYFHSDLHLILDSRVGLYLSFNSRGDGASVYRLRSALFQAFLDRYFPARMPDEPRPQTELADNLLVSANYVSSVRSESNIFRALTMLDYGRVRSNPDRSIQVSSLTGLDGQPSRWREIRRMLYREAHGPSLLAFVLSSNGAVNHVAWSDDPTFVLQPAPRDEKPWVLPGLGVSVVVLCVATLLWPIGALIRRRFQAPQAFARREILLRRLARLAGIIWIGVLCGWISLLLKAQWDIAALSDAIVPYMYALYALGVIGFAGTALSLLNAAASWRAVGVGVVRKLGETCVAGASLYLSWFMLTFHFLSFSARF